MHRKIRMIGIMVWVMAVVCALLLTGCSEKENENRQAAASDAPSANAIGSGGTVAPTSQPDFSKRIPFTYPHMYGHLGGQDPMYEVVSRKFNVDIEYIPVTWDNWIEKTNIWISSGALPDVLWWDLRPAQYAKFAEWCRYGVFKEIPELGGKYPNLNRVIQSVPVDAKFLVDGKRYMIPHYEKQTGMESMEGVLLCYRKDWAEKLGFTQDIFTFEDLKRFVKACIEKDPGGNGPGVTKGIVGPTWMVPDHVFMLETSPFFASYVKKGGKYVWGATLPETLEGILLSKELYDEGIIDPDFYTANDLDGDKLFLTGKAAVWVCNVNPSLLKRSREQIKINFPELDADQAVMPMKALGPHGRTFVTESYDFWSVSSFSPDIDDETLERVLYMMDWACTDEAAELVNYGIRGVDWDMVDGEFRQLWESDGEGRVIKPAYMDYAGMYGNMGTNGGHFDISKNLSFSDRLKNDILSWVAWRKSVPHSVQTLDPDLDFLVTPGKAKYGSFYQEVKDKIKELIISSNDITGDWNAWLKMMEPRVAPILQEINEALVQ